MSSRNERQSSTVTESFWLGARNIERNFPPKIRVMGDSADLTCSRHQFYHIYGQVQLARTVRVIIVRFFLPTSNHPSSCEGP